MTLLVKHFSSDLNVNELRANFSKFGEISRCKIIKDNLGNSKKFGYVTFEFEDAAVKAIIGLNGKKVLGARDLYVGFAKDSIQNEKFSAGKVFVKNLNEDIDEVRLKKEFSFFGEIVSTSILKDKNCKSNGRGFVCFQSIEDAVAAVLVMNGRKIESQRIYTEFSKNVDKVDKELRLSAVRRFLNNGLKLLGADTSCLCNGPFFSNHLYPYGNQQKGKHKPDMRTLKEFSTSDDNSLKLLYNADTTNEENDDGLQYTILSENSSEDKCKRKILINLLLQEIKHLYPGFGGKILRILMKFSTSELSKMSKDKSLLKAKCDGIINMKRLTIAQNPREAKYY